MSVNRDPILKRCRSLQIDPSHLGIFKESKRAPQRSMKKMSEYGLQLREKQKVKRIYGVLEKQFRDYFEKANHQDGITGENLLQLLERRLDNVLYRMGFASSRAQSRNFIGHGHVLVNDHKVDIVSYQVKVGDKISFKEKLSKTDLMDQNIKLAQSLNRHPAWVTPDYTKFTCEIASLPAREHVDMPIKEQVIVELYSK